MKAIFRRGSFRPTVPVTLKEGAAVTLSVRKDKSSSTKARGTGVRKARPRKENDVSARLRSIAELPMSPNGKDFSGRDHDRVLYGDKGAR
ncbi:MAG: antitoxin AF2212-like protein [Tepidisphaeraceae bacterium]